MSRWAVAPVDLGDCASGNWCDETTRVQYHDAGQRIAHSDADASHTNPTLDGSCTLAAGSLVCASGACDATDNLCGYANGDGPCTVANGVLLVGRSGSLRRERHVRAPVGNVQRGCELRDGTVVQGDHTQGALQSSRTGSRDSDRFHAMHTGPTPANGGTCTASAGAAASAGRSGVCDAKDNKCGYANTDGPCSASNATVCRSDACSVNGACEPAGSCNVDADCPASRWCKESAHTCDAKLSNGASIPTDATHANPTLDAICTAAAGALVCARSGVSVTRPTTSAATPTKMALARSRRRRSAAPARAVSAGRASPPAGATVDADCTSGTPVQGEHPHKCAAKLSNGAAIPTDAAHTNPTLAGACTASAGALVCASRVCDTADNKCGYANGDGACTVAEAGVCRSSTCSTNGRCEPAGGCEVDTDCGLGGTWCKESAHACVARLAKGGIDTDRSDARESYAERPVHRGGRGPRVRERRLGQHAEQV